MAKPAGGSGLRPLGGEFGQLEYDAWDDAGVTVAYDGGFGPLTVQAVGPLLDAALGADAGITSGGRPRVLDAATGPGYVAAEAARRGHRVVGLDWSESFLGMARKLCAGGEEGAVEMVLGDAQALPFGSEEFDAVCCNFGVLHFPEPKLFFREVCRVLKPNGVLAFTVWQSPPATFGFEVCHSAVKEHGNPNVPLPAGPSFFLYADPETCRQHLTEAGFQSVECQEVPMTYSLPYAGALFEALRKGTARSRALLAAQTEDDLAAIEAAINRACEKAGLRVPMPCVLVTARKPRA